VTHISLYTTTTAMSYPNSHKTIFVLDYSPQFSQPCDHVEFDMQRTRGPGFIPLVPITKSIWTCTVEATLEYCRIVWDIFAESDKCIRYVVASPTPELLNGWQVAHQNSASLGTALTAVRRPTQHDARRKMQGDGIVNGVTTAMEALCETTTRQEVALQAEEDSQLLNRGRVVVLTCLKDEAHRGRLITEVMHSLSSVNKRAADNPSLLPISHVEVVFVHVVAPGTESRFPIDIQDKIEEVNPTFSTALYTVPAGPAISSKLLYLCLKHYDLASTTVTGIPMKEEQNASSSANYDVELFHSAESHIKLVKDDADMALAMKEGCEYQTATLKWCTPRGTAAIELHHTSGAFRVTPVEVNSRQSSCLTNFLLSGRSVMLEMQKRASGAKTLSHMLTSHGGEIFIHSLSSGKSPLDEPPSISEGPGGRVTDYRIRDLAELMKSNMLAPWPGEGGTPGDRAETKMARFTKFFPYTISSTTIFNMAVIEPLQAALTQESMTEDDVTECRKVIYQLMSMEQKGEVLPGGQASPGPGKKGANKKEEQYRVMFNELERFVQVHSDRSPQHLCVLECLMEVRNKPIVKIKNDPEGKVELDVAIREFDKYKSMTERERSDFNLNDGVLRSTTDSPLSPTVASTSQPPLKKQRLLGTGGATLLEIWKARLEKEASLKHVEFAGRSRNMGEIAKLYVKLESNDKETEVK